MLTTAEYRALEDPRERLEVLEDTVRRYLAAVAECRVQSTAAIMEKGAARSFDEGYPPLDEALVEFKDAGDALEALVQRDGAI